MASDRGVPGATGGVFGDLLPSFARSQPPAASPDPLRRANCCHAAVALQHISKVMLYYYYWPIISIILLFMKREADWTLVGSEDHQRSLQCQEPEEKLERHVVF